MTSSKSMIFGIIACVAGSSGLSAPVMAQDWTQAAAQQPNQARAFMALDRCAAYGPDFTSVEGTQTCVRIGGHVRVEIHTHTLDHSLDHGWSEGGTAPTAMRTDAPLGSDSTDYPSGHLRLPQDSTPSYDGTYLR
jgi:hypothetical protein